MNTISTYSYRRKYRLASLDKALRKALVAEAVCDVDRSGAKYIDNPYGNQPTATVQALAGTYSTTAYTLTDDTLTVTDEFIYAEHIYDFEEVLTSFNIYANRVDEQNYAIAYAIDYWVINNLCEDGTGTYTTPAGGFTTAANIVKILAALSAKVAGYAEAYKGLYLIIENSDITGFLEAQVGNGFSIADMALKNGFLDSYMGIDIYVVRDSTFADTTSGTTTWTNSGHRVFGVRGISTYAAPQGITYEELLVTGKTGKEVRTYGYCGFKQWATKATLTVDITIA